MPEMNLDDINAIDFHTHVSASVHAAPQASKKSELVEAMGEYFGTDGIVPTTVPMMAEYYRQRRMACVVFTVDATAASGSSPSVTNEEIASLAVQHSDVIIPFASVDPHAGKAAATNDVQIRPCEQRQQTACDDVREEGDAGAF